MKAFTEIVDNIYQYKTLGLSRQADEGYTCDCTYEPGKKPTSFVRYSCYKPSLDLLVHL